MRYLVRSAMDIFNDRDLTDIIVNDKVGSNSGNMLFVSSIVKNIYASKEDTFKFISTKYMFSYDEVEKFNKEYDMFIIPLANAFRSNFIGELNLITDLVNKLKIPSVVIGVGLQEKFDGKGFKFDKSVKRFVKACTKNNKVLGLRGQNTANYLEYLGFKEHKHYEVIGCPSMFFHGDKLEIEKKKLNKNLKLNITLKHNLPEKYHQFVQKTADEYKNHIFTIQNMDEIILHYLSLPLTAKAKTKTTYNNYYPRSRDEGDSSRVIAFVDFMSWTKYVRANIDLSCGNRIHGNIVALLSGKPCFIIACDSRVQELCEYHKIPHVTLDNLDLNKSILDYYKEANYDDIQKNHKAKFDKFINYLRHNNITTIYDTKKFGLYEKKMSEVEENKIVPSFTDCTSEELLNRIDKFYIGLKQKKEFNMFGKRKKVVIKTILMYKNYFRYKFFKK